MAPSNDDATVPAPRPSEPDSFGSEAGAALTRVVGGRYEIIGLLGTGGMGAVYRVKDRELGEMVALKALLPGFANGTEAHARFRREVRLARRVTHKNVARTYDLGEADGHRFLTMELVEGISLGQLISRRGALAIDRALDIGLAICAGVGAAHEAGVIHRDLKPDNVIIANDGRVVVTDFGVARGIEEQADTSRGVTGTPAYMAPEQIADVIDLDGRADQYALGVILYEMVTGEQPFPGNALSSLAQRLTGPAPDPLLRRPDLGDGFARAIRRCLARERSERFESMTVLADELLVLRGAVGAASPAMPSTLPPTMARAAPIIAVLPFDVTDAAGDVHIAFGLSDGLIDALATVANLQVCPRGVTARIVGTPLEIRERARLLGAQLLVTGSVRVKGRDILVKARLATVDDGFVIWRQHFAGNVADVARCAEEASAGIALALSLSPPKVERNLTNAEALDLYLRGRYEYFRYSPAANARACELLQLASERSPNDPVILSAYAMAAARQLGVNVEYAGPLERAQKAAQRAYQIAPARVEPLVALGTAALHAMDGKMAADLAARALALPLGRSSADAYHLAARVLLPADAISEGTAYADMTLELEPRYGSIKYAAARAAALAGDWSDSEQVLLRAPFDGVSPFVYWLERVRMCYWLGNDSFIEGADMSDIPGLDPIEKQLARDSAMIIRERKINPELVTLFAKLVTTGGATPRMKALLAEITVEARVYLGQEEEAHDALMRAVDGGLYDLPWIRDCPALERLRTHPEVRAAIEVVGERARAVRRAFGLSLL